MDFFHFVFVRLKSHKNQNKGGGGGFSGQEINLRKAPILFEKTVLHDEYLK